MALNKKTIKNLILKYGTNESNINLMILYICTHNAALSYRSTRRTNAQSQSQTSHANQILNDARNSGLFDQVCNEVFGHLDSAYGVSLDKTKLVGKEDDDDKESNCKVLSYEKMTIEQLEQAQSKAIDDNNKDKFEMINKYIATKLKTKTLEQESIKPIFYIPKRTI